MTSRTDVTLHKVYFRAIISMSVKENNSKRSDHCFGTYFPGKLQYCQFSDGASFATDLADFAQRTQSATTVNVICRSNDQTFPRRTTELFEYHTKHTAQWRKNGGKFTYLITLHAHTGSCTVGCALSELCVRDKN
jgi:hypothetical protein